MIVTLEHDGVLILGGDNDVDDIVVDNVAVGCLDLTDVVGADRKIDGYRVTMGIGGHGAVHNARVVEYLEHSAGETDVGVLIQLPDRDVSFEHVVDDRVSEVVHVLDVLGVAREVNGIGLGGEPDGGIGNRKLTDVVVTRGQIVLRGRGTAVVGDEHLYEGIHGQDTDGFRGIEAEHEVRAAYGIEGEGLVVPLFGHLAELEGNVLTSVEHLNSLYDNGSIAVLIADRYGIVSGVDQIAVGSLDLDNAVIAEVEIAALGNAVFVGGNCLDHIILGIEDLEHRAFKAAGGEYGSVHGAPIGIGRDDGGHGLAGLLDTDAALGALVDYLKLDGVIERDLDRVNGVIDPVGSDRGDLLDVDYADGQVGRGRNAVITGGHGLDEVLAFMVGIDAELDAAEERAVIALLDDAETAERLGVDGNGSGGNDLCGRGAHKHVLKIVSVGDICRHVRYAAGVPALSGKHEGAAVKGLSSGNSERIVAGTGVAVNGHAGGKLGGVEGIAAVDVCKRYSGLTGVDAAVLGEPERSGIESDVVLNSIPVPRVLEELIRPGKHVLVAGLGADPVGMRGAVREAEGTGFALLGEPETDRVGSRLTGFVIGKTLGKVAGISVHEYRLQAFESSRAEERRGRGLGVAVAVGVALGVLDTVDDLTGLHYPVARCIEVLPCAVGVILQVIERAVILRLDRNGAFAVGVDGAGLCERAHGDEGNAEKRREQQRDETCRFLHLIFRLFLKRHPFSAVFAVYLLKIAASSAAKAESAA